MRKLNNLLVTVALIVTCVGTFAEEVKIDVDGFLTTTTCRVEGQSNGKYLKALNLDTVSRLSLAAAGEVAGQKELRLNIDQCESALQSVSVIFENRENFSTAGRLINKAASANGNASDVASNVEIQVLDAQRNAVLNLLTSKPKFAISAGKGVVPLAFRYYATGVATSGRVEAVLELSMEYN